MNSYTNFVPDLFWHIFILQVNIGENNENKEIYL